MMNNWLMPCHSWKKPLEIIRGRNSYYKHFFSACLLAWMTISSAHAQTNYQKIPEKTRILFLLDGSGSMLGKWERSTRIMVAKRLLAGLVDSLQVNPNVELALRVYGHQFHRRLQNCQDSKLEVGFGGDNNEAIISKLKGIKPQGTTPIAYSLEQAARDFPQENGYRNIVIIITDGLESCDGDPCAISMALQTKRIFLKPFVIGLGMNKTFEEQFSCVGQFFDASNINAFRTVLNKTLKQTLDKTTASVELLDINNQPKETNVNVTFFNNFTGQAVYEFVHYLDQSGRPDTVVVDAVLSYDIVVNTIPPVTKRNVTLDGGAHNVIRIKAPQGQLKVVQKNQSEYGSPVKVMVRKRGKPKTLTVKEIGRPENFLVGDYDLEILTLPRIYRGSIKVEQSKTTIVDIPAPGVFNINSNVPGVGSLYHIQDDASQKWIRNLRGNARETLAIQPGDYKVVFRANKAKGSKFSEVHNFTIKSGSTKTIKLFGL